MLELLLWTINLTAQHAPLNLGLFVQYGSSNLDGFQFVKQNILYLPPHLLAFLYNQYVIYNVMNTLL
jgi:hypothetical protein